MAKVKTDSGTLKKSTAVAKVDELNELNTLREETVALEAENQDAGNAPRSYLRIIGNTASGDRAFTNPKSSTYIKGAADGMWIIPSKKLYLGHDVKLTVKGIFSLYADTVPGDKPDDQRKTVTFWHPDDAVQVPLGEGEYFDRIYFDAKGVGHRLQPVHWAFVRLDEFPEIDDGIITFRSKGNSVCKALQKLIASEAESCTELRLSMSNQIIKSAQADYLYPMFEIVGRNSGGR